MTTKITGIVRDLEGRPLVNSQLRFERRSGVRAQDGATVVPRVVNTKTDAGGNIAVDLYPGEYKAQAERGSGALSFNVGVPEDVAEVDLQDLLDQVPAITPMWSSEARKARDEAVEAADSVAGVVEAAEASATSASDSAEAASGSANSAADSASTAESARQAAQVAETLAGEWAENPEDDPVVQFNGNQFFSAKHHAAKAAQSAALSNRVIYVDTIADLQALNTSPLPDGQQVSVTDQDTGGVYRYDESAASDGIAPDSGDGRWFLVSANDQGRPYATRAAFEADVAGGYAPADGTVVSAGGVQYVREEGADAISDLPSWAVPASTPKLAHWGAVGDGATDNTAIMEAVADFCTETGRSVYAGAGGVYMMDTLILNNRSLILKGEESDRPILKTNNGQNNHGINTIGDATLSLTNIIIDHNRQNQTAGHGLRSGGCKQFNLLRTKVQNAFAYGIGLQSGTARRVRMKDIEVDGAGGDGIDIKDQNFDNELIEIEGYIFKNIGIDDVTDVGLDVRGSILASRIRGEVTSQQRGVRLRRFGAVNGSAAKGSINGIFVVGDGSVPSIALQFESDEGFLSVSNVYGKNVGILLDHSEPALGGIASGVVGEGLTGNAPIRISGARFQLIGLEAKNIEDSPRIIDIRSSASDFHLSSFNVEDLSGNAEAMRIQSGAADIALSNGQIRGGTIGDGGTDTVLTNVRFL